MEKITNKNILKAIYSAKILSYYCGENS